MITQYMMICVNQLDSLCVAGKLTFGSWAYHGLAIDIREKANAGDMTSYISNGEWDLLGKVNTGVTQ